MGRIGDAASVSAQTRGRSRSSVDVELVADGYGAARRVGLVHRWAFGRGNRSGAGSGQLMGSATFHKASAQRVAVSPRVPAEEGRHKGFWRCGAPDWPASAAAAEADLAPDVPVAVLHANRVVACSASARRSGVRRGMRKRQAQAACPEMVLTGADGKRDGHSTKPIAAAVMAVVPTVEVPGRAAGDTADRHPVPHPR